jgi:predicted O-methyltransferase YrrM
MKKRRYARFRRLIIGVFSLVVILGSALWWFVGAVGLIALIPLSAMFALLLHLRIMEHGESLNERGRRSQLRQVQALASIHGLLPLQRPLPPMGDWAINPDFAELLVSLIQQERPAHVLELGCGASTIIAAYALQRWGGGQLVSIDHQASFADIARREINNHGLSSHVRIIHAPLRQISVGEFDHQWYDINCLPPDLAQIDLLIVDGPPRGTQVHARYPALPVLKNRLRPGAMLLLDDGKREDERAIVERWCKEIPGLQVDYRDLAKGAYIIRL